MTVYIVGDVHGDIRKLDNLLEQISPGDSDEMYFVGDLVNGGDDSAEVIRRVMSVGQSVLGNHDLHMLAVLLKTRSARSKDTFRDVADAKDKLDLMDWLLNAPLMIEFGRGIVCHAGLFPGWTRSQARRESEFVADAMTGKHCVSFFETMYGNEPSKPGEADDKYTRFRFAVNAFTRMRVIKPKGGLDLDFSGTYNAIPDKRQAWFDVKRPTKKSTVYFGHWAALGMRFGDGFRGLDSGCRWGGPLTALSDDGRLFQAHR